MADGSGTRWREWIAVAQGAVRGTPDSLAALQQVLDALPQREDVLDSPASAGHFAHFVALLRDMGMSSAYEGALDVARQWVEARRVPVQHRCLVHNRLATVLDEGGDRAAARTALDTALHSAATRVDEAYTFAHHGVLAARHHDWPRAVAFARQAQQRSHGSDEGSHWLEIRMRTVSVLFLAACEDADDDDARRHARSLELLCQRQIDRWGSRHPRALEALVTMASARHEVARIDGDLTSMDRLTDVLAVAAQRTSATLGARHPQAEAVRAVLRRVHAATERARAAQAVAEQTPPQVVGRADAESPQAATPEVRTAVLELLVHGFEGTPPEEMLGDPRTVRIAGDDRAAVYRRADDVDAEQRPDGRGDRPVPEAYVWHTSMYEHVARALWLLLLPLSLVNLAHWMRPAARGRAREVRVYGLLVRLAGLSLTVLLVAAACEVALDLAAWQCAGTRACAREHAWLRILSPEVSGDLWWGQPGRRLAAAAVVPAALVCLLWWLSCRTWSAYESQQPVPGEAEEGDEGTALGRPGFWFGRRPVARLRVAHVAAGFLTVAGAVGAPALRQDRVSGGPAVLEALGWALLASLGAGTAAVIWIVCRRGRSERRPDQQSDSLVLRKLPAGAGGLLVGAMLYAGWSRPDWHSEGRMPGGALFGGLAVFQCALVLALVPLVRRLRRTHPDPRAAMRGMAGPALVLLSCALGTVLGAGLAQRVGDWLNGGRQIAGPPVLLAWQVAAVPPLLIVLVALFARLAWRTRRLRHREMNQVPDDYPGESWDTVRIGRIASSRARARLIDAAPPVVGVTAAGSLVLCAAVLAGASVTGRTPGEAAREASGVVRDVAGVAEASQVLGSWLTVLGFLFFVVWGLHTFKARAAHRTVGVLWDIGAFWPRAAHPLAPPCYAERAVPDLAWRITTWVRSTGGHLVVSAHAQGSVLAAAAVWQLGPPVRARVALQTYGSPLERLYGRWFPAHFGPSALSALHRDIEGWRNLYRLTDALGGPVRLGPSVDRGPLNDPLTLGRTARHPLPTPILGNADYRADPAFMEEETRLLARLRPEVTATPASSRPGALRSADVGHERPGPPMRPGH